MSIAQLLAKYAHTQQVALGPQYQALTLVEYDTHVKDAVLKAASSDPHMRKAIFEQLSSSLAEAGPAYVDAFDAFHSRVCKAGIAWDARFAEIEKVRVQVIDMGDTAAKAEWTAAFINDLPDASFLYIAPGGELDEGGKTKPRSLRYFPVRGPDGEPDLPHLRNAIARIPQSTAPGLTQELMAELQDKARAMLGAEQGDTEKQADTEPVLYDSEDVNTSQVKTDPPVVEGEGDGGFAYNTAEITKCAEPSDDAIPTRMAASDDC